MIYRSNLTAPDLTPNFKHVVSRPMGQSFGHDVLSDWGDKADDDPVFGLWKKCGFWTHDEAAILYNVARAVHSSTTVWLDIGAHTGWTTAHAAAAGNLTVAVDPLLRFQAFQARFQSNVEEFWDNIDSISWFTSSAFFEREATIENPSFTYVGVCIDGDHDRPKPLEDAKNSAKHLADTGVIILHDFWGEPVQEAVTWLLSQGFQARIYVTPHGVAACWRGDFVPPNHIPDPNLPDLKARCPKFDFRRCV